MISKCGANCSILSDIYWFDSLSSRLIPPALNHFAPGPGPSPGRSRRGEIMQADNASRQSITLMACTMMPLRFLTNFRLLQLSICMAGKGKIWASGYLCFLSVPVASAVLSFCPLFSSASEHNDETTSVASVQMTGPSASSVVCPPRSSYLDLFWSGFADFFSSVSQCLFHHLQAFPSAATEPAEVRHCCPSIFGFRGESNLVAPVGGHRGNVRYFTHIGWL